MTYTLIPSAALYYWNLFHITWLFNLLFILYVVFMEKKNSSATWAWILILLFVPIIGFILYLFIGQDMHKRKMFNQKEEEDHYLQLLHGQATRLAAEQNEFQHKHLIPYKSTLKLHLLGHQALYTQDNTVSIYIDGPSKFNHLFDSIKNAKHSIHLEYYIIREDSLGKYFKELLIEKAKEGVEVLLLYDGMGCLWTPKSFFQELKRAGVQVCCFFPPFLPYINLRVNYRNHRKICVIDSEIAYIGGFNIGTEYMGLNPRMGFWRDTHLSLTGSSVTMIDMQFLLDWRFASKKKPSLPPYPSPMSTTEDGIGIQIVSGGPDSKEACVRNGYLKMITEAKDYIYLQTPYFIPDEPLFTALKIAVLSGVTVKIMIPNKPDHLFVYWASYSYLGELLKVGAKCYTYEKGFLHAKMLLVDDQVASVGTTNFDLRSLKLNFEVNAFIYDVATTEKLSGIFRQDLMDCKELTLEVYQARSNFIKFKEAIARLISPIL